MPCQAISEDLGIKLEKVTIDMLGRAKRVMIDKENTTIIHGAGKKTSAIISITTPGMQAGRIPRAPRTVPA